MKVSELKSMLQDCINTLEDFRDDDEVYLNPNTYGIYPPYLGTRNGFIELNNPVHSDNNEYGESVNNTDAHKLVEERLFA